MKVYTGIRVYQEHEIGTGEQHRGECRVKVDGKPLPLRLDLANHSPTGFEWGYGGSGPAQLALALLADALGDADEALLWYQPFKEVFVSRLERDEWLVTEEGVRGYVEDLRANDPKRTKDFEENRPFRLYSRHLLGCKTCRDAENGEASDWCPEGKMLFRAWEAKNS